MSSSSSQESNGIHFFKVILERTLQQGKLRVPTSFVKKHWEGIKNPVSLRLPNKREWKVNWKEIEGDILFCDGWKEFAKDVCLSKSQFVVFGYEGNSCFNVNVLGKHGLEIIYEETRQELEQECEEVNSLDDDVSFFPAKRSNSSTPISQNYNNKRKTNPKKHKELCHLSNAETKHRKRKVQEHSGTNDSTPTTIEDFLEEVKKRYRHEKDFFTRAMHKTYIERDQMVIPNEYCKLHKLHKMDRKSVTLFVVDNKKRTREWDVQLKKCYNGQFTFCAGWKKFSKDNNLDIGDVCAFVSTRSKDLCFQVITHSFQKEMSTYSPHVEDQEAFSSNPSLLLRTFESPKLESIMITKKEFVHHMKLEL